MAISRSSSGRGTLVWDNHACLPLAPDRAEKYLPAIARYKKSGVDVVSINIGYGEIEFERHIEFANFLRERIASLGRGYVLVDTVDDIIRAQSSGALAVCFDAEGAACIDHALTRVATFHRLGVRWMLIAYNRNNAFGGGCHDSDAGLTPLGRRLIAEMNRVGMVVCCSHTGYRTAFDAIEHSRDPVVFSHSNPRALRDHPRNIPDDLIRACARRGGVVGINGVGIFLGNNDASVSKMAEHIDYVVQLVGIEHVGIGTDFVFANTELEAELAASRGSFPSGWGYDGPIDFLPPEELPRVVDLLVLRGYSAADIAAVVGGNFLRIARSVWKLPT
jgi:membrane dipeptidase